MRENTYKRLFSFQLVHKSFDKASNSCLFDIDWKVFFVAFLLGDDSSLMSVGENKTKTISFVFSIATI